MRYLSLLRMSFVVAALCAALSAHAFFFNVSGLNNANGEITGTTYRFSNLPEFNNTFGYYVQFYGNGSILGSFSNGASTITYSGTGSGFELNNVYSGAGTFTVSAAANTSVKVGASGTYSWTLDKADGYFSYALGGSNPVPEPASFAVVGIGIIGLCVRRRNRG